MGHGGFSFCGPGKLRGEAGNLPCGPGTMPGGIGRAGRAPGVTTGLCIQAQPCHEYINVCCDVSIQSAVVIATSTCFAAMG